MIESKGRASEKTLPFVPRRIGCHGTNPVGKGRHIALRFTPPIMRQAETAGNLGHHCPSNRNSFKRNPCVGSQGDQKWAGRGACFRDFLCLPPAKENRSNRRTFSALVHESTTLTPRITEGWGKKRAARARPFPYPS